MEISRIGLLLCAAPMLVTLAPAQNSDFSKYKKIETYQVRPGVLMTPRYNAQGEVCEMGFQRQVYSPEVVRLYSTFTQSEVDSLIDEFAPTSERGPRTEILGEGDLMAVDGAGETTIRDYEDITVDIMAPVLREGCKKSETCIGDPLAIVIKWKHRRCD